MKVSVITVCYNSASTIEDTVRSVLNQDYPQLEYIVIDGASKDGTLGILQKYKSGISKLISEPDEGMYHALNKGIEIATGDVIAFLHADDVYAFPGVISGVAEKMKDSDALYGDLVYVQQSAINKISRYWKSGHYFAGSFKWGWMPPHPSFFVRKEVYNKFGTFNTQLRSAADYELMLRFIHKYGVEPVYWPEILVKMRSGGKSNVTMANRLQANKEDRKAWQLNGITPFFFTLWIKPLRKIPQYFTHFLLKTK
ncbi:MAG: glycosyltransferase [Bacteroidia bacterium]|nr:glycosyltransferase [Bacteroidia bacterium]MBP9723527.1 glycosyltransferase [Bacteroidia bacterium]